jgi:hypothetical protein
MRETETDSSFTTPEPTPKTFRSSGPRKRSGPRSHRMTSTLVVNFPGQDIEISMLIANLPIAHDQQGQIIRLRGASRELLYRI